MWLRQWQTEAQRALCSLQRGFCPGLFHKLIKQELRVQWQVLLHCFFA